MPLSTDDKDSQGMDDSMLKDISDAEVQFSPVQTPILLNLEPDMNLEYTLQQNHEPQLLNRFEQVQLRFKQVQTGSNKFESLLRNSK